MSEVGIIGLGYVGSAVHKLFPDATIFDPDKGYDNIKKINDCKLAIICVPTPMSQDGSCDVSIIEEILSVIKTPLVLIKSTIPPGTTKMLKAVYKKRICFSPEYIGEGNYFVPPWKYPDPKVIDSHTFMIIGGDLEDRAAILPFFQKVLGPDKFYFQTDSTSAEIIKYMENAFLATKIAFCNEFYNICQAFKVDYNEVREGWLLDERIGRMHTNIIPGKRGFGGKCLIKDTNAIVKASEAAGYNPKIIKQVLKSNKDFVKQNLEEKK